VRRLRRSSLPADVRSVIPLGHGERPLAYAKSRHGQWWVGTLAALYLPRGGDWVRLPWAVIEHAEWRQESGTMLVTEAADFGVRPAQHRADFDDASKLLQLIRERVTASVVLTRFVPVVGRVGMTLVGRRAPGTDGSIEWSFVLAEGLDPDDPQLREIARRALVETERELG
jgi:hypothetical protein